MRQIRNNVFETNSSSTHSLTMATAQEYDDWKHGKTYMNNFSWYPASLEEKERLEDVYKKPFLTREEIIDLLMADKYKDSYEDVNEVPEEEFAHWLYENDMGYDYDTYWKTQGEYFETFERTYTTKGGETVVAFGYYGYDG